MLTGLLVIQNSVFLSSFLIQSVIAAATAEMVLQMLDDGEAVTGLIQVIFIGQAFFQWVILYPHCNIVKWDQEHTPHRAVLAPSYYSLFSPPWGVDTLCIMGCFHADHSVKHSAKPSFSVVKVKVPLVAKTTGTSRWSIFKKVGIFSSSLEYLQVLFCFFKKEIRTQSTHYSLYWVIILRENRIWNLAVKMTTHSLSSRNGNLALPVLTPPSCSSCSLIGLRLVV